MNMICHCSAEVMDPVAKVICRQNNEMRFLGMHLCEYGATSPRISTKLGSI